MLQSFIDSATKLIEEYTGRCLITQTWDMYLDAFGGRYNFDSLQDGIQEGKLSEYFSAQSFIEVPKYPLQSVTYLRTYDDTNTAYTMPSTDYFVDTFSEPGRLSLTNNSTWPSTFLRPAAGIQIRFICGYGNSADVPAALKEAVKRLAASYYSNRGCSDSEGLPSDVLALIAPYRTIRVG